MQIPNQPIQTPNNQRQSTGSVSIKRDIKDVALLAALLSALESAKDSGNKSLVERLTKTINNLGLGSYS